MISIPFKKGEIVLATIPYTDLRASNLRPALVVSAGQIGQDLTIAAISSNLRDMNSPFDVAVTEQDDAFAATGLQRSSVVRAHHLITVERGTLARRLGHLDGKLLQLVDQRLKVLLMLES